MKAKILTIAFTGAVLFSACSNNNSGKTATNSLATTTGKPRPIKSSEGAENLYNQFDEKQTTYFTLTENYVLGFPDTAKIKPDVVVTIDTVYNQACKIRDAITSVGDELDTFEFNQFNQWNEAMEDRKAEFKVVVSKHQ